MASPALVDTNISFGRELIGALDAEPPETGLRPSAAFWFYVADDETWRLVLSLPALEQHPPQEVYRRIIDVVNRRLGSSDVPMDDIGLAHPDMPLLRLLRSAVRTGEDAIAGIRFTHNVINGELIDDAYIYRL